MVSHTLAGHFVYSKQTELIIAANDKNCWWAKFQMEDLQGTYFRQREGDMDETKMVHNKDTGEGVFFFRL